MHCLFVDIFLSRIISGGVVHLRRPCTRAVENPPVGVQLGCSDSRRSPADPQPGDRSLPVLPPPEVRASHRPEWDPRAEQFDRTLVVVRLRVPRKAGAVALLRRRVCLADSSGRLQKCYASASAGYQAPSGVAEATGDALFAPAFEERRDYDCSS